MAAGDCGNIVCDAIGGAIGVVNGVSGAVSFASDPFGATFKYLKDAANGLTNDILPALTTATLPDLNVDWFINAYRISFATAIFVAVLLLIPQFLRTARGTMAGRDLVESVGLYFGLFLVGAMFGPAFGAVLVTFFHSLSDVFIAWGIQNSTTTVIAQFQTMIANSDPAGITGGVVVAILLMACFVIGMFLVLLMLIVQLVTLYFTGVLMPLGLVWIIDKTKRSFGLKLVRLWIGLLAAHPLLFFLLGFTFSMTSSSVSTFGSSNVSLQKLVTLVVAILSLFMAALSPLLLMKFAPVIPAGTGGTQGPSLSGGGNTIGSKNMNDAMEQFGSNKGRSSSSEPSESDDAYTVRSSSAGNSGSSAQGGSLSEAAASRAAASSGETVGAGSSAATAASSGAAGGAAGAAGSAGAAGAGAAEGMAAAGAAESATGVGAAIGIPTIAAAAVAAGAQKGVDVAKVGGEHAIAAMDEPDIEQDQL
ncbi:hypothetical protein [Subtercola sp. RTI3]|uniref:hypothetical protein n=1 Tax=Subtercola sp. RTI3 TaxID=3048639 RepID=UPI002B23841D|nr:hypothetical protein [Subtercola sp. RTI3]MEA9986080.1 hypothetical protein [Subtercola sp. RTI3]